MGFYAFDGDAGGQVPTTPNLSFGDTQGVVRTESIAVYADWTFDMTTRLKLDAGLRYTDETSARRCSTAATPTPRQHAGSRLHGEQSDSRSPPTSTSRPTQEPVAESVAGFQITPDIMATRSHRAVQVRRLQHPRAAGAISRSPPNRSTTSRSTASRSAARWLSWNSGCSSTSQRSTTSMKTSSCRCSPATTATVTASTMRSSATSPTPARARSTASRSNTSSCQRSTG